MSIPDERAVRIRDGQKKHQHGNPTTARPFRASNRRLLTPQQRGPFCASVGELIEQARRAAP